MVTFFHYILTQYLYSWFVTHFHRQLFFKILTLAHHCVSGFTLFSLSYDWESLLFFLQSPNVEKTLRILLEKNKDSSQNQDLSVKNNNDVILILRQSHYRTQAGLKFSIFLLQPSQWQWDYRCVTMSNFIWYFLIHFHRVRAGPKCEYRWNFPEGGSVTSVSGLRIARSEPQRILVLRENFSLKLSLYSGFLNKLFQECYRDKH